MYSILRTPSCQVQPPPGAQPDSGDAINQGLVGWWPMNEGGGQQIADISGNGNHGILTNMDPAMDWVAGQNGYALDLDGGNDVISLGTNNIVPTGTQPNSVSLWMYYNDTAITATVESIFFLKQESQYCLYMYDPGADQFDYGFRGTNLAAKFAVPSTIFNRWVHLVAVYYGGAKGTPTNYALWFDGAPLINNGVSLIGGAAAYNTLGSQNGSSGLKAAISNFRIFNRSLSTDNIITLYSQFWAGLWTPTGKAYFHYSFPQPTIFYR